LEDVEDEDLTTFAQPSDVWVSLGGQLLFVPEEFLDTVLTLLRERSQLIFYGPPGTGKTYIARKLMEFISPEPDTREVVQFHPSYSYEDFVEGYRPTTSSDGRLSYQLQAGPLLQLAEAAETSKHEHVLLIDEINRGNLPRILGELLYALEYRGEPVRRMYSAGQPLVLPRNLLVLGTMNTADKSIGLIDAALRRRFHFVALFPGEGPLTYLLAQWLDNNVPEMIHVAGIVDRLNAELRRRVGPPSPSRPQLLLAPGPLRGGARPRLGGRHPALPRRPVLRTRRGPRPLRPRPSA
jgi:5-methylcytosine-specific restriction protein B